MSEKTIAKAKEYLTDGRVLALSANGSSAEFAVQGSASRPYIVNSSMGHWHCDCRAEIECAHILACKLIYKSTATKPVMPGKSVEDLFASLEYRY